MTTKVYTKRFVDLAQLLCQIMVEEEHLSPDFKMSKEAMSKTAAILQSDFENGILVEDENKMLYYAGMIEDYGGLYEEEINKSLCSPKQIKEYFNQS